MTREKLVKELRSDAIDARITATYELDYDDFVDPAVIEAARDNLDSADAELVAITIMRLLVRGKDAASTDHVWRILRSSEHDYVVSSAILALANLAREMPSVAQSIREKLETL